MFIQSPPGSTNVVETVTVTVTQTKLIIYTPGQKHDRLPQFEYRAELKVSPDDGATVKIKRSP